MPGGSEAGAASDKQPVLWYRDTGLQRPQSRSSTCPGRGTPRVAGGARSAVSWVGEVVASRNTGKQCLTTEFHSAGGRGSLCRPKLSSGLPPSADLDEGGSSQLVLECAQLGAPARVAEVRRGTSSASRRRRRARAKVRSSVVMSRACLLHARLAVEATGTKAHRLPCTRRVREEGVRDVSTGDGLAGGSGVLDGGGWSGDDSSHEVEVARRGIACRDVKPHDLGKHVLNWPGERWAKEGEWDDREVVAFSPGDDVKVLCNEVRVKKYFEAAGTQWEESLFIALGASAVVKDVMF